MARLPRLCPAEIPQHIIQRGNNRQVCFGGSEDMAAYLHWLKQYAQQFSVDVHAWVLMVNHPKDYSWSSYQCNDLGKVSPLCCPHPEYLRLGSSPALRQKAYCHLFDAHLDSDLLKDIRGSVNSGLALGTERFKDEIEYLHNRRVRVGKSGRPVKALQAR